MPKKKQTEPYTEAFRKEAIRRSEKEGVTAVMVAKELEEERDFLKKVKYAFIQSLSNGKNFMYMPTAYETSNVAENILNRNFTATTPDEKWVSDITYIDVDGEWMHLAVIQEFFSKQIVGWADDETMTIELIFDAFNMAVARRKVMPGLILHSDRGVQYRSGEYKQALEEQKIIPSMSPKGNCWDNAVMESFFARLKVELIYVEKYKTLAEAYSSLFEYIEVFYNRIRRHSSLGYKSPVQFEENYHALICIN